MAQYKVVTRTILPARPIQPFLEQTDTMTIRLFLLIATLASLANAAATSKPRPPICIVGAGVSGLTAAKALEDKGYKTVVFEKRDTVGGKCQSHYEE